MFCLGKAEGASRQRMNETVPANFIAAVEFVNSLQNGDRKDCGVVLVVLKDT